MRRSCLARVALDNPTGGHRHLDDGRIMVALGVMAGGTSRFAGGFRISNDAGRSLQ
jgi:hypothetical protein